jgi:hypothetical protein
MTYSRRIFAALSPPADRINFDSFSCVLCVETSRGVLMPVV